MPKGKGSVPALSSETIQARLVQEEAERVVDAILGFRVEIRTLYRVERDEDGRFQQVPHSSRPASQEERAMYAVLMHHAAYCAVHDRDVSRT